MGIESILKKIVGDSELLDFKSKVATNAGDNYMSVMYSVQIDARSSKTGAKKTYACVSIIFKTLPPEKRSQSGLNY